MNKAASGKLGPVLLAYVRYSDLYPKIKPKFQNLQAYLERFDLYETILILSKINLLFSDIKAPHQPDLQILLSKLFLNDYTLNRFKRHFQSYSVFFHRHQMLFMMKNAFLICRSRPLAKFTLNHLRQKLGTCCLIANDLLNILELDENELDKQELDEKKESIWKESLPGWELNNPPALDLAISRMRRIFGEILSSFKDNDSILDLNKVFQAATTMTIHEFMFFVFGLLSIYLEKIKNKRAILNNPAAIFIEKDRLLERAKWDFPRDKLDRFFEFNSLPLGQYQSEISAAKDFPYNYGFLPFRKRPIVNLDRDIYFCLDFQFLLEKMVTGIFWIMNDYLEGSERRRLHSSWGLFFEAYINKLIAESLGTDSGNFFPKPFYDNTKDEIADAILLSKDDIVIFEYKFTILTQEAKFEKSVDSLINEIKLKFERNKRGEWKGYGQLANTINKLFSKSGDLACEAIKKQNIKRIFPVLIVYEHILQTPFTNYIFNRDFQNLLDRSSLVEDIYIFPLTLMTIEDFEKSTPFLSTFAKLIGERFQLDSSLNFSFSEFLRAKYAKEKVQIPENLRSEYRKFAEEIRAYFFNNMPSKES